MDQFAATHCFLGHGIDFRLVDLLSVGIEEYHFVFNNRGKPCAWAVVFKGYTFRGALGGVASPWGFIFVGNVGINHAGAVAVVGYFDVSFNSYVAIFVIGA